VQNAGRFVMFWVFEVPKEDQGGLE
jgi:hypothetical protein